MGKMIMSIGFLFVVLLVVGLSKESSQLKCSVNQTVEYGNQNYAVLNSEIISFDESLVTFLPCDGADAMPMETSFGSSVLLHEIV